MQKQTIDISYESILKVILVLFTLFFVFQLRHIIFIIFISVILALIANPAVDKMQKKKIPRVAGAAILFLSAFMVMGLLAYIVAPPLAKEVSQLTSQFPAYLEQIDINSSFTQDQSFNYIDSEPFQNILIETGNFLKNVTSNFVSVILGLLGGLLSAILILVISFYFIVEEKGIEKFVENVIPYDFRPRALKVIKKTESKLGKWFIGQLFLGLIVGLLSFIGLSILGVPYALVLGIIAGMMELIPYIGPTLASIPAILIAFTVSPLLAVLTLLLYFLIQQFENYLIVPKVMERSVGLHPVIIIIAMLIGGQLAGILGVILAIPVTTIISIILEDVYKKH
jgi:predicted PurR-regulated permease PerM